MRVQWSRRATLDLQRIAEYLREQSPAREEAATSQLIASSQQLATRPRQRLRREGLAEVGEIRTLLVGKNYRLVYEIISKEKFIVL